MGVNAWDALLLAFLAMMLLLGVRNYLTHSWCGRALDDVHDYWQRRFARNDYPVGDEIERSYAPIVGRYERIMLDLTVWRYERAYPDIIATIAEPPHE
jgi:hypothetical protein